MSFLNILVTIFISYTVYIFIINRSNIEQFKEENISKKNILARIETLENLGEMLEKDFKEMSTLMGYTLESIDSRVKKNEEKLKKLSLRQRDAQAEIKEIKG